MRVREIHDHTRFIHLYIIYVCHILYSRVLYVHSCARDCNTIIIPHLMVSITHFAFWADTCEKRHRKAKLCINIYYINTINVYF